VTGPNRPDVPGPILFLHPSDEAYGADRILVDMVEAALASGRPAKVLVADDGPPGWVSAKLASLGVPAERVDLVPARRRYLRPLSLLRLTRSMFRARRLIRSRALEFEASIIHVNTSALLVGALLGRPGGARVVWHVHEIVKRPALLALLFRTLPVLTADRVIVVSESVGRHLRPTALARRRVVVLHNGLAPHRSDPASLPVHGHPKVAFVGRLNWWKGYELFVAAAGRVGARHPEVGFIIAGDPPIGEEWRADDLKSRVTSTGLGDRIAVVGYWPDSAALFDAVEIVVVPSTSPDPLPTVVLEAMRSGCAVSASNHGGAPEMIEDGVSGLLVAPGDLDALTEAIDRLVSDEALRRRLGGAAQRQIAERFTIERFREDLNRVWSEIE
jgi:glycosyltransferase involved in cell wall biosynthesis